jgi:predicted PurR-regulated permease PerM
MKKMIVFSFFLVISPLFADETGNLFENISFWWQLSYFQHREQEIDFINVNPLFFSIDTLSFPNRFYEKKVNTTAQKGRTANQTVQENDVSGFFGFLFVTATAIFLYSAADNQEKALYEDTWEWWQQEDSMRQRFKEYNYRSF